MFVSAPMLSFTWGFSRVSKLHDFARAPYHFFQPTPALRECMGNKASDFFPICIVVFDSCGQIEPEFCEDVLQGAP